ncbi:helix-turn-helix domain-containing protein [Apilactobacillus timberlakei]|uniref:helix-turn-helix domain-containing protein n=1 Tax=Apilactobacillus timberlakei TaxID=2008380 RepID=UPI001126EEF0|nr:helix-turn-helix transcriptional regulator [Apilactobacillus timberlakei]TPR16279.1 XRE family transcriptional regulator [Apilactobacillus timberlakei]TPR21550.1 XRE family transcriptional regulator [Apilactobacillus timberlakei]
MRSNSEIIRLIDRAIRVNGFSYAEFAQKVHMSTSAISRYINNERPFSIGQSEIFAKELGVSVEWLLGTTDDEEIFLSIFNQLNDKNKENLLDYAHFIYNRQTKE